MKKIIIQPEKNTYIKKFIETYPELYRKQDPDFYQNKCSIISIMFAEMLIRDFSKKNVKGLWGYKPGWKEKGISHVVISCDGITYDMTYAQISRDFPSISYFNIEEETKWKSNYKDIEERNIDLSYCNDYKKNWKTKIESLKDTDYERYLIGKKHLDDLEKFSYI